MPVNFHPLNQTHTETIYERLPLRRSSGREERSFLSTNRSAFVSKVYWPRTIINNPHIHIYIYILNMARIKLCTRFLFYLVLASFPVSRVVRQKNLTVMLAMGDKQCDRSQFNPSPFPIRGPTNVEGSEAHTKPWVLVRTRL